MLLALTLVFTTACTSNEGFQDQDSEGSQQSSEEVMEEEDGEEALEESELDKEIEDAEIVAREASDDEFYGSWTAPSEKAEYLYGNIDLTIKSNRTWKGNVTNISLKGSWEPYEGGIHIKDKEGLINWKLYFTEDNVMLMEDIDDLGNPIVLKKK